MMGPDLKTELQRLHSRLNALLMADEKPLSSIVIKRYKGVFKKGDIRTMGYIYVDTSTRMLYMDLNDEKFESTAPVSDLPFHKEWCGKNTGKNGQGRATYTLTNSGTTGTSIAMVLCYLYPFVRNLDRAVNPGYMIQDFDTNGNTNATAPVTYQDIQNFFRKVHQYGASVGFVLSCTIGPEESILVTTLDQQGGQEQKSKVVVTKDLTCQQWEEIEKGEWHAISGPTHISRIDTIKNVIGGCGGWNIINIITASEHEKRLNS
jgi:hypothetical protein